MPRFYSNDLLRRGLSQHSRAANERKAAQKKAGEDKSKAAAASTAAPKVKPFGKKGQTRTIVPKAPRAYPDVEDPLARKHRPTKPHGKVALRKSIKPGTILIVLAGRYKAKRVVFLKQLDSGLLLITGPFRINGVPLRRINQRYVIATRTRVKLGADFKLDQKYNDRYFKLTKKEQKARKEAIQKKLIDLKGKYANSKKAEKEAKAAEKAKEPKEEAPKKKEASKGKGKKEAPKKVEVVKKTKAPKSMWELKRRGRRLGGKILPATRKEDQKTVDSVVIKAIRKQDPLLRGYLKARFALRKGQYPHAMKF